LEYTIQKLAQLAGVSTRTLRYYDEIGLLPPKRINSSGYRIYGRKEVDRLQQIMFYRELGIELETIKQIIDDPSFSKKEALRQHRENLLNQRKRIDLLLQNIEKTLNEIERGIGMTDQDKFLGFKTKVLEENERKYGKEIREKYGEKEVEASNAKFMNMSQEEYARLNQLEETLRMTLKEALKTDSPTGELGQKVADLHRQWLMFYWPSYSKEAHRGLAQMYLADDRFKEYYDNIIPGAAKFLHDAILAYTGNKDE